MNFKRLRVLVTGGEGYLGKQYIKKLVEDLRTELVVSIDPRNKEVIKRNPKKAKKLFIPASGRFIDYWSAGNVVHFDFSVTDPDLLAVMIYFKINVVAHFAWQFNPTHYLEKQRFLDIDGTRNVLFASANSPLIEQIIYTGSSTAYGQISQNDHPLREDEWQNNSDLRLATNYQYSRNKAEADFLFQNFKKTNPGIYCFWTRAAIVLGPNTPNNIVACVAKSPFTFGKFMFKVKGFNPPMQFLSEYDMTEILFRATMERWTGPVNVAGEGTLLYSEVIYVLGKKKIELSQNILYWLCYLGWNLRIGDKSFLKFPPNLIETIQYPWVGDISLLKEKYSYTPSFSSFYTLTQFAETFK